MAGSILIVCRNCISLTKLCVKSALEQSVPCDVLVIDNASSDGTSAWLRTKPIAIITLPTQLSLAACWNRGIRAFWNIGRHKVLVCNNDIVPPPYFYKSLDQLQLLFVTGISVGDRGQVPHVPKPTLQLIEEARPHPDMSAFMITGTATDTVGWFDESYFPAYAEDSKFHVLMHRAGINTVCVDLPFYHERSSTLKNASPGEQLRIERGAEANRERFRREFGCRPDSPEYAKLFLP